MRSVKFYLSDRSVQYKVGTDDASSPALQRQGRATRRQGKGNKQSDAAADRTMSQRSLSAAQEYIHAAFEYETRQVAFGCFFSKQHCCSFDRDYKFTLDARTACIFWTIIFMHPPNCLQICLVQA